MERNKSELLDEELVKLSQSGDKEAENIIALRYGKYVEAIARPYFLIGAERDDLHQIGMIGLLRAVRNFEPAQEGSFKTYAARCIKNAVLDAVRESNAKKNLPLNSSDTLDMQSDREPLASYENDPERSLIAKEAEEALFDALSSFLGEKDLAIIKLYLSSVPYKEISEKLGVTAKKVDNTIYNAKKKLEKLLKKND